MRRIPLLVACIVLALAASVHVPDASAHQGRKAIWEHAVDVQRFFVNHPDLASTGAGKRALSWHTARAYDALIWKWNGVHECEGAWDDPGAPYYGGLQMDWGFMSTYGGEFMSWWGTADNWPAWAQMTAAERAFRSGRGYGPWPVCGAYGG